MAAESIYQAGSKLLINLEGTERVPIDAGGAVSLVTTTAAIAALFDGNVSGNQTLGNLTITGELTVDGTTTLVGNTSAGNISVTGLVAAGNVTSAGGASGTFNLASTGNITVSHGIITAISA
jgi:hypothetical protein